MHLILHGFLLRGSDVVLHITIATLTFGDSKRHLLIFRMRSLRSQNVLRLVLLHLPLLDHGALGVLHVGGLLGGEEGFGQ